MKMNLRKAAGFALLACMAAFSACKKDSTGTTPDNGYNTGTPTTGTGGGTSTTGTTSIKLATDPTLGSILTNKDGRTLYFFAIDADGQSGCNGGCSTAWPTFYDASLTLASGLTATDFGTITRADGSKQTTYKGWPLYTFAGDSKAGDVNGEGSGKTWFVAKPDYTVMLVNKQLVGADGANYTSQYVQGTEVVQYITDAYGRTLYHFKNDKAKTNNFTKADLSNNAVWPINEVTGVSRVPSILNQADFGTITVFGKTQLTYKGWPLYMFGADNGVRGNNKGVSVGPGAWPVNNAATAAAL
ncbi:hypothetical protein GCM10027037_23700 [Mucilaginibacter koreensis]